MGASHPRRTAAIVGVAGAGLALGHWLAYSLGTPRAELDELLHATGHGYLAWATQVALLAGVLGLAVLFLARLSRREARGSFARDAAMLTVAQSLAFVAMEVGERLASGATLHDLAHGPLLAIGLGVQLGVALVGAGLLRLTDHAAEAAGSLGSIEAPRAPAVIGTLAIATAAPAQPPGTRPVSGRAPPLLP
jgi:hypothetical protein